MKICLFCTKELKGKYQNKFCNNSCSASYNNKGVRRHGKPKHKCKGCEKMVIPQRVYCSTSCFHTNTRKYHSVEERLDAERKQSRERTRRYEANKKHQTPVDANLDEIKEFYMNCPEGYEIDHIKPISKGGTHSIDNLQYLTPFENKSKGNKYDG